MSKHKGGRTLPQKVWTPFQEAVPYAHGKEAKDSLREHETLWANSFYVVHKFLFEATEEGAIHLSIRHQNRKAIRDWRHFQRIKNELVGAEREAIEIFPPESQLVDTANQYHLFVLPAGATSPFTWNAGRRVTSEPDDEETRKWIASLGGDPDTITGAVQRPIEEGYER